MKVLFVLIFIINFANACGLCTVYSPQTLASLSVNSNDKTIESVDVVLKVTEEFTQQLKELYDTNSNAILDKDELLKIQKIFEDYAKTKRYFLTISYDRVIRKETFNKIKVSNFITYIENDILHFKYRANLNYKLYPNYFLRIYINDNENFFSLSLDENSINFKNANKIERIVDENSVIFSINSLDAFKDEIIIQPSTVKEVKEKTSYLSLFTKKIKSYLLLIKKGDSFALLGLLFISFVYGIIHALGPGHGKSLAFSYFLSNKSSFSKAFVISQATAFVHIIGALILVVVSVLILETFLNNFVNDAVILLTKISAILIILLSLYLLYNKVKQKECACSCCQSKPKNLWSTVNPNEVSLLTQQNMNKKQDLYFVLTEGLVPCPGTVILFIYAFILKTYFAVFLAAIAISLGMGLVIFMTAFLGLGLKNMATKSHKITLFFEIAAPIFMLLLGVLLYFNAEAL